MDKEGICAFDIEKDKMTWELPLKNQPLKKMISSRTIYLKKMPY